VIGSVATATRGQTAAAAGGGVRGPARRESRAEVGDGASADQGHRPADVGVQQPEHVIDAPLAGGAEARGRALIATRGGRVAIDT
jgi:hypothetical protein